MLVFPRDGFSLAVGAGFPSPAETLRDVKINS